MERLSTVQQKHSGQKKEMEEEKQDVELQVEQGTRAEGNL